MSDEEFRSILARGLGEASMCWDPMPSHQVFDSNRAVDILDRLVDDLRERKMKVAMGGKMLGLATSAGMKGMKAGGTQQAKAIRVAGKLATKGHLGAANLIASARKPKLASVHHCKSCGKSHAPRCDRCGATSDLRSYHGPCGKCAFGKTAAMIKFTERDKKRRHGHLKGEPDPFPLADDPSIRAEPMKVAMYAAFADELEKIAAGYLINHGTKIVNQAAGWAGRKLLAGGKALATAPGRTLRVAGESVSSPMQTLKAGWKETWNPKTKSRGEAFANKAFFAGGTALQGAAVLPSQDPMGRDESRLTRSLRFGVGGVTGIMGMKRGILPSIAMGLAGDVAGGAIGRGIDKARGYKPRPKKNALDPMVPQRVAGPVAAIPEGNP